jgi:hypothetical protein
MAGRTVKRLYDLEIDEISLVDRSANQHADVAIAKRDEGTMTLMDVDGYEVAEDELQPGDVVYDAETGEEFVACEEGAEPSDYIQADEDEVGKAFPGMDVVRGAAAEGGARAGKFVGRNKRTLAAGAGGVAAGRMSKRDSLGASVYEELSKALTTDARDEVISKALQDAQAEVRAARAEAAQAQEIAKNLQDQAEFDEYYEIAKGYGPVGDPEEIALLLKQTADTLGFEAVEKMHQMFSAAGEQLFAVYGSDLGAQDSSVMAQIEAMANQAVAKADVSEAAAIVELFTANPDAYEAYLAEKG